MSEILPQKISAALVVYKEESVIRRCLESISGVVDEIVVVHDGEPQDNTLEIAKEFTDKLFVQSRVGEAEPLRVFSFEQCTGDWILQIDADEYLSDDLRNAIRNLVTDENINGYSFLWKQWDGNKYITANGPYKPALFRKSTMHYVGVPHFQAWVDGKMVVSTLHLEHKPVYNNFSWSAFRNKRLRFSRVQATYLTKNFSNVPKFQVTDTTWPKRFAMKIQYSYIAMIVMPFLNFSKVLFDTNGTFTVAQIRRAFYEAVYIFFVYAHVTRIRLFSKNKRL